jgi:hypothetical protein
MILNFQVTLLLIRIWLTSTAAAHHSLHSLPVDASWVTLSPVTWNNSFFRNVSPVPSRQNNEYTQHYKIVNYNPFILLLTLMPMLHNSTIFHGSVLIFNCKNWIYPFSVPLTHTFNTGIPSNWCTGGPKLSPQLPSSITGNCKFWTDAHPALSTNKWFYNTWHNCKL